MTDYELEKMISELEKADKTITDEIIKRGEKYNIACNKLLWDGVVSAEKYLDPDSKPNIMWMLKETKEEDGGYKLLEKSKDEEKCEKSKRELIEDLKLEIPANKTLRGVIYVTYSLLNNYKTYNEIEKEKKRPEIALKMVEVLQRIAFVNVSKECRGNKTTNMDELEKLYNERWKEILFKQIKTYSPKILIFGGTFKLFIKDWKENFGSDCPKDWEINYFFQGDMLIVPTWHPSFPFHKKADKDMKGYVNQVTRKIKQKMEERNK